MAVDLMRALAPLIALAAAPATWALGSAAPFVPPRTASAPALAAPAASGSAAAEAVAPGTEGLAGVRLGVQPMALIDGRWWRVGDLPRGARMQTVDAWGVTLRHPDGKLERLMLHGASSVQPRNDVRPKGQTR